MIDNGVIGGEGARAAGPGPTGGEYSCRDVTEWYAIFLYE